MPKDDSEYFKMNGVVKELLPNAEFIVTLENGHDIRAIISGRMRTHYIRTMLGDKVTVEISMYDLTRGRIIRRDTGRKPNP